MGYTWKGVGLTPSSAHGGIFRVSLFGVSPLGCLVWGSCTCPGQILKPFYSQRSEIVKHRGNIRRVNFDPTNNRHTPHVEMQQLPLHLKLHSPQDFHTPNMILESQL